MVTFERIVRTRYVTEVRADSHTEAADAVVRHTTKLGDVVIPSGATHLGTEYETGIAAVEIIEPEFDDQEAEDPFASDEPYGDVPALPADLREDPDDTFWLQLVASRKQDRAHRVLS